MLLVRSFTLTVVLVVLATKNSAGQSEDATKALPSTCSDDIEMCKDDLADSDQTRADVLLYKLCISDVNCDDSEDDTALKNKEIDWAKKNVLHYSLLDDGDKDIGTKPASCVSPLTIILFSLLIFIYRRI